MWILIFVVVTTSGTTSNDIEFSSKEACHTARLELTKHVDKFGRSFDAICVTK